MTIYPHTPTNEPGSPYPPQEEPRQVQVQLPQSRPYVAYTILGITLVIFVLQILSENLLGFDYPMLLGMKQNDAIQEGQLWRLLTPMLLHGGLAHIGFNMYALYIFGPRLERFYGHLRFLMLYLLAAFTGNVFSFIFSANPSVGASTAIFGLVAAEGIFVYMNRFLFGQNARSMLMNTMFIVGINLFLGLSPGIDNWGHLGGLVGGLLFALAGGPKLKVTGYPPLLEVTDERPAQYAWLAALVILLVFVSVAFYVIYTRNPGFF